MTNQERCSVPKVLSLNGIWQITGYAPDKKTEPLGLEGHVPGHVHLDLMRSGTIPDPFWRDNAEKCQWVERWDWRYSKKFELPDNFLNDWCVLKFSGLDTFATIILNGIEIGKAANMFIPHCVEVTKYLHPGQNTLEVLFSAPSKALSDKSMESYFSCFSTDRVYARKMQCTYGWDWVHRLVSGGIWRPVELISYSRAKINDVFIHTVSIEDNRAVIQIELDVESRSSHPVFACLDIFDSDNKNVFSSRIDILKSKEAITLTIDNPQLWWPNDHGKQPLYSCATSLQCSDDAVVDMRNVTFGIRTVELEQLADERGSSFTFIINGRRIFCKGGNWVPADPFPSRISKTHYECLISHAQDAHFNMLRAWGGGIYEPQEFWNACDRMGIMVIQDFLLACAQYPEDDTVFFEELRREFSDAIKLMRNHASLVLWSGDNELGMNGAPSDNYCGKKISEQVSRPLCRSLDPSRPYLPTSPFGGTTNNSTDAGDCHVSPWYDANFLHSDMSDYRKKIDNVHGRFVSECALPGAPSWRSLLKFMTENDIAGPNADMWEYHTKDNLYNEMDDLTHYQMLVRTAENLFGKTDDPRQRVRHMEYVQCEFNRLITESLRRRKFDCSGVLFWMYNDCWPASGWSVIDYYGFRKAGYYGLKRAYQPLIAAIEPCDDKIDVWICSDYPQIVNTKVTVRFQPWTGIHAWQYDKQMSIPANSVVRAMEVDCAKINSEGIVVCDLVCDSNSDRSFYYSDTPSKMRLPSAQLSIEQINNGRSGSVIISTDCYARVVTLDADLDFSDNYFDLLPKESRKITWTSPSGNFSGKIPVSCWNRVR